MKICLFADASSVHIRQLASGLASRGHHVHIVTYKSADVPGATVERFRVPGPALTNPRRWEGRRLNYLRGFMRWFDVVNIHFLQDWGFRLKPAAAEKACFIVSAWGSDIVDPPGESPAGPELRQTRVNLLNRADGVTTCGPTFAGMVADYAGIAPCRIDLMPFGVDLEVFRAAKRVQSASVKTPVGPYRVGFFKGFREVYGPTFLLQAIPLVRSQIPNVRFELVGDGPELSKCHEMAFELGVDSSIKWIPRQSHVNLPKLLAGWDLSVIPSMQEAFGVAALESSAMQVPVVASDIGGLRDTVRRGETGVLVPPGRPRAIADAIVALLNDLDLRRRMGRAGREMVETQYDWRCIRDRWLDFYVRVRHRVFVKRRFPKADIHKEVCAGR